MARKLLLPFLSGLPIVRNHSKKDKDHLECIRRMYVDCADEDRFLSYKILSPTSWFISENCHKKNRLILAGQNTRSGIRSGLFFSKFRTSNYGKPVGQYLDNPDYVPLKVERKRFMFEVIQNGFTHISDRRMMRNY